MHNSIPIEPIDYLVIGHITKDLVPGGYTLGGTASYASLTAHALGLKVGVVTACDSEISLNVLKGIAISVYPSEYSTTFQNINTPSGRIQHIHHQATLLDLSMVPEIWRKTPIIHLGPIAREVDPKLVRAFPYSFIGLTLQGWLRGWNDDGHVHFSDWPEARFVLESANAAVVSIEDVENDESRIEEFLSAIRLLVVTEGAKGARIYWNGEMRTFCPPQVYDGDATGAGDIFATSFFFRYNSTRDPWEAARFATNLASLSVTRTGLQGVPTSFEVQQQLLEVA
jgi:sugar/nucleoside kinase (ribokinase family)